MPTEIISIKYNNVKNFAFYFRGSRFMVCEPIFSRLFINESNYDWGVAEAAVPVTDCDSSTNIINTGIYL